jgi:histidinol-phosphate phosphatase family protein
VSRRAKALILAAGVGSRLRPVTDSTPKCLVPVAGRPILDYWLEKLARAGVHDALLNTHVFPDQVRSYLDDVRRCGLVRVTEFHEPVLLGSAGTLAANPSFADDADDVIVIYPDNLSTVDLGAMLAFHRSHSDPFTMLLFRAPNPRACGIAELDRAGRIISFVEKPPEPRSDLANAGVYILSAEAYREAAAIRGRDIAFDVLPRFVGRMRGWAFGGYHRDIGTPADLEAVNRDAPELFRHPTASAAPSRPAVFLDRDGTVIEDVPYLSDPARVRLIPGAADAIIRLRTAGLACVLVTNQSAIGRGLIDEQRLREIHETMIRQLRSEGAALDAIYHCPVAPTTSDRTAVEHPDRKPGPGMLRRAAADLALDLPRSWAVGDMVSDVLAGYNAGCQGAMLVRTGSGPRGVRRDVVAGVRIVDTLRDAADFILARFQPIAAATGKPTS